MQAQARRDFEIMDKYTALTNYIKLDRDIYLISARLSSHQYFNAHHKESQLRLKDPRNERPLGP